jgi:hypothetical protein
MVSPFHVAAPRQVEKLVRCDACERPDQSCTVHPVDRLHYCDDCAEQHDVFAYDAVRAEYLYTYCHACNAESPSPRHHRAHCETKRHRHRLQQLHAAVIRDSETERDLFAPLLKLPQYTSFITHAAIEALPTLSIPGLVDDTVRAGLGSEPELSRAAVETQEATALDNLLSSESASSARAVDESSLSGIRFLRHDSPDAAFREFEADVADSAGMLGFDTEGASSYVFPHVTALCHPPHVMQIATARRVYLYELSTKTLHQEVLGETTVPPAALESILKQPNRVPRSQRAAAFLPPLHQSVAQVLGNPQHKVVGFAMANELNDLRRHNVHLRATIVDIGRLFFTKVIDGDTDVESSDSPHVRLLAGGSEGHTIGAQQAIARFFGKRFDKPKGIQVSNWTMRPLSVAQMIYAARDAAAARMLYVAMHDALKKL